MKSIFVIMAVCLVLPIIVVGIGCFTSVSKETQDLYLQIEMWMLGGFLALIFTVFAL